MKPSTLSTTLTVIAITGGNILGPLALFGGAGWLLAQQFHSNAYIIVGILVAFIMSNFLILTTTSKYMKAINRSK